MDELLATQITPRLAEEALVHDHARADLLSAKLDNLLQLTQAIHNNFSRATLYTIFAGILQENLGISRLAFAINDGTWKLPLCEFEGIAMAASELPQLLGANPRPRLLTENEQKLTGFEWVVPVLHKDQPLAYLLTNNLPWEREVVRKDMLDYLRTLVNIVAIAVENKRLVKDNENKEAAQLQNAKDLDAARQVQAFLIPQCLPANDKLAALAFYHPNRFVGGDYYTVEEVNIGQYLICIADVSGKGMGAALLMASFQAHLSALLAQGLELEKLIHRLNLRISELTKGDKYITAFIGLYNEKEAMLEYVNCGHVPPVVSTPSASQFLRVGSIPLGIQERLPQVVKGHIAFKTEAHLLCYTDGLSDLQDYRQRFFSEERIGAFFHGKTFENNQQVLEQLLNEVDIFRGKEEYNDDLTILSIWLRP